MDAVAQTPRRPVTRPVRLGVVSFINTLPLIDGLEQLADVELRYSVPSRLLETLLAGEVDLGLCSSIDFQRACEPLVVVPAGCLGCEGSTLTVRLYSSIPPEGLQRVHCDTDSHTSVILLGILLREMHGTAPTLVEYGPMTDEVPRSWPEAVMLIGDKVVTDAPPQERYPYQLDLGAAWRDLTGLPFVFALWMARTSTDPALLDLAAAVLDRQRRHNRERLDGMVHRRAVPRGWPRALASDYLASKIRFDFDDRCRTGLELFWTKAADLGFIEDRRPLVLAGQGV
jgi:chorismate dehydratase